MIIANTIYNIQLRNYEYKKWVLDKQIKKKSYLLEMSNVRMCDNEEIQACVKYPYLGQFF